MYLFIISFKKAYFKPLSWLNVSRTPLSSMQKINLFLFDIQYEDLRCVLSTQWLARVTSDSRTFSLYVDSTNVFDTKPNSFYFFFFLLLLYKNTIKLLIGQK